MRIEMKKGVTLQRKGGGTVTFAAGGLYDVDDDTAAMLGDAATVPDAPPVAIDTIEEDEPNLPPPVTDTADDIYEEEE